VRPWREPKPLAELLVEGSTYPRGHLKRRLFAEGIKEPRCEVCGQGELWRGARMALILDHVNGVWNDNRLENLRILCPNCNATLDTHCGRKNKRERAERACAYCGERFWPRARRQRFCSRQCGVRHNAPALRRVERPPYDQLVAELAASSFLAVGRKYGVSDNAIRKWIRWYERQREATGAVSAESAQRPPPLRFPGDHRDRRHHGRRPRDPHALGGAQDAARDLRAPHDRLACRRRAGSGVRTDRRRRRP
jgi:hypothetical protein